MKEWIHLKKCPGCLNANSAKITELKVVNYYFGKKKIIPPKEISIYKCTKCNLIFKSLIPSKEYLSKIYNEVAGNIWNKEYNYGFIIKQIEEYADSSNGKSILDIGPANGDFLRNFNKNTNRLSGLDLMLYPELESSISGEFINGLIDDVNLKWSGEKYDIITAFDVFEHLYDPQKVFKNINELIRKGGYLFIETGNAESKRVSKYGLGYWYYATLFEHHLFWSKRAIKYYAEKFGFKIVTIIDKKHKNSKNELKLKQHLKLFIYTLLGLNYFKIGQIFAGKTVTQPVGIYSKDHIFVVLKKI